MDQASPSADESAKLHNLQDDSTQPVEIQLAQPQNAPLSASGGQAAEPTDIEVDLARVSPLQKWDEFLGRHPKFALITKIISVIIPLVITYVGIVEAVLPRLLPTPPMAGGFNVAVAPFTLVNENGKEISSTDGQKLADFVYHSLLDSQPDLALRSKEPEIRGPQDMEEVRGADAQARARAAEVLADKINAHILIYGTIHQGENPELRPEFFVSYRGFEQADEIVGSHQLGNPLLIELPFDEAKIQGVENPALSARVSALTLMVIGLAYDSIDKMDQAISYYQKADQLEGWLPSAGKEVLYLMLGNANLRQASIAKDPGFLPAAQAAYQKALAIDPQYPRALIALGGVAYLQALGDPGKDNAASIDLDKLEQAEQNFQAVLGKGSLPQSMNIPPKVHFNLGQVYLARAQVQDAKWLASAQEEFQLVIAEFEAGNTRIREMAAQAYARRALIYRLQGEPAAAVEYYEKAIAHSSPYYQAYYTARMAEIYVDQGKMDQAIAAFEEAIKIAEFYTYPDLIEQVNSRINELQE